MNYNSIFVIEFLIFTIVFVRNKLNDIMVIWQMAPQDLSTMLRLEQRNIIFLINNGGYTIEVEIHDGPYNVIKNWDYTALVDAMHNQNGNCWTAKVNSYVDGLKTSTITIVDFICIVMGF